MYARFMSKSLMAKWTAWAATIHLHNDDKPFTADDQEYALSMAAFYAGYNLRDDEAEAEQPVVLPDRDALAQILMGQPVGDWGQSEEWERVVFYEQADALRAALPKAGRVEWGVQVGTWPPTEYQNREIAEHRAKHPFVGEHEYQHTVVTRTQYNTPWVKVQS